jgi:hypothetical protein
MPDFSRRAALLFAIILLASASAKAADVYIEPAFEPLHEEEIANLDAPYRKAVKKLSADERQRVRNLEIQFMKTLVPASETMRMVEHLKICRSIKAQIADNYEAKVAKISTYNKKLMNTETRKFFEIALPAATYMDPKILRNHLIADQMISLEVNQKVIIQDLQKPEHANEKACYVLRDQIDQYLIDNNIHIQ